MIPDTKTVGFVYRTKLRGAVTPLARLDTCYIFFRLLPTGQTKTAFDFSGITTRFIEIMHYAAIITDFTGTRLLHCEKLRIRPFAVASLLFGPENLTTDGPDFSD